MADSDGETTLRVEDLRTEFRLRSGAVRAVDGLSLRVGRGECVGLVGESGCGKTTLGLSILNLLPPRGRITSGAVCLGGRNLVALRERELRRVRGREVSMIFQDPLSSLNPTWSVGRQIIEAIRLHEPLGERAARRRALELLSLVGVPRPKERFRAYPHQLSGGQRQRAMIAIALACSPRLLIADEPTTALDVTIQAQILDLIDGLRRDLAMAVLLITHDLAVVASRTDRVMVMYAGRIVEEAATAALFASPRHPYTEALLRSIPRLDEDRSQPLATIPGSPPSLAGTLSGCRFASRCSYATARCSGEEPQLQCVGLDPASHRFACFHPLTTRRVARVASAESEPREQRSGSNSKAVIQLENVFKQFAPHFGSAGARSLGRVKAVSGVSFAVRRAETFALVGESGCGKTTIGRLIVGLERPDAGVVRVEGERLSRFRGTRPGGRGGSVQLVFQDPYTSLDPRMRVGKALLEPLAIQRSRSRAERNGRVHELLSEVGLPSRAAELYPHELSGGQRQRVGLARALALNPNVIVADEPVSALDVSIQAQILNLMRALQIEHALTYVFISHDLAVVRYIADTVAVMYLGKLVEIGPADDVFAAPVHPYTQALIEVVPVLDPVAGRRRGSAPISGELPSAIDPPSGCRFRTRCPRARDLCAAEEPRLRGFAERQLAACHFPLRESALEVIQRV